MTSDCTFDADDDPPSIVRHAVDKTIDEILNLAAKDRAKAIQKARRVREWLRRKNSSGQAHRHVQDVIEELDALIDILRKDRV